MSNFERVYTIYPRVIANAFASKPWDFKYVVESIDGFNYVKPNIYFNKWDRAVQLRYKHNRNNTEYITSHDINIPFDSFDKHPIDLPISVDFKPLSYRTWRIYNNFDLWGEVKDKIIDECIVKVEPEDIDIYDLCEYRTLFWKSLYKIIVDISGFTDTEISERQTAHKIEHIALNYNSTLDGIYDLFVFSNYPDKWEYYRKLNYYERLDFLGLIQASSGINLYERVMLYRKGITSKLVLSGETKQLKEAREELEKIGLSEEQLNSVSEALREDVSRHRRRPTRKRIRTESENRLFLTAGDK